MKRRFAIAHLGMGFAAFFLTQATWAQVKWDLPSAYPATNFHTENLQQFAKDIDVATGGKLKITVHPGASLFKAPEIKRAVQGGQVQIGEILLANFENENPVYGADGVPFLASNYAQSQQLADAQKPLLEKLLASQGMKLLYTVPWPPQGIYVKREISSVYDMKGIKWRAYSPATAKIAELIGAQPVTVQAAEVSQAFATGIVESMMTSAATGYDTKVFENVKFWYDTQAWLPKNAVIVNTKAFEALSANEQAAVLKAAQQAQVRGAKLSQEKNEWYKKALTEKGMKLITPSAKLAADMRQVGATMLADWEKKAGADGQVLLKAYRSTKK